MISWPVVIKVTFVLWQSIGSLREFGESLRVYKLEALGQSMVVLLIKRITGICSVL